MSVPAMPQLGPEITPGIMKNFINLQVLMIQSRGAGILDLRLDFKTGDSVLDFSFPD